MKRRAIIDLTPMLDVILLLVFGFLFMLSLTNTELLDKEQQLEQERTEFENSKQTLNAELESKDQEIDNKNEEIEKLLNEINEQQAEIEKLETENLNSKKAMMQLEEGIKTYFYLNEAQLKEILEKTDSDDAAKALDAFVEPSDAINSVIMYNLLSKEFFFIDFVIKGNSNRVYINDKATSVMILREDTLTTEDRNEKIQEIKDEISLVLDERIGGSSMAFVSLSTDNEAIYHYAWSTAWKAVKQLEEKYGAKNYYCAEIFVTQ